MLLRLLDSGLRCGELRLQGGLGFLSRRLPRRIDPLVSLGGRRCELRPQFVGLSARRFCDRVCRQNLGLGVGCRRLPFLGTDRCLLGFAFLTRLSQGRLVLLAQLLSQLVARGLQLLSLLPLELLLPLRLARLDLLQQIVRDGLLAERASLAIKVVE